MEASSEQTKTAAARVASASAEPARADSVSEERMLELLLDVVAEHSADGGTSPDSGADGDDEADSRPVTDYSPPEETVARTVVDEGEEEGEQLEATPSPCAEPDETSDSSGGSIAREEEATAGSEESEEEAAQEVAPVNADDPQAAVKPAPTPGVEVPVDLAASEGLLPAILPHTEASSDGEVARKGSGSDSLSARSSSDGSRSTAITRQRSSSVEGPTSIGASILAARILGDPSSSPSQRRQRSTTSSQLERPEVAARGWNAILEEEKRENMSVVKSFGHYRIGEMLGKGGYGKVYQGLNTQTGELVAVKEIIMKDREFVLEELPLILAEIKLHQSLNHPNIVGYVDFHRQGDKSLYIILELLEGGSLHDLLKRYSIFPEALAAQYSYQILLALEYLHDRDILHRDIKGANVLLSKDGYCKLADFGLALHLDAASLECATPLGTSYWMAPEIFCMESPSDISKAADVWSFGCTLMELITGHPPYHHMTPVKAMFQILESDYPPLPPNASPDLREFLHLCFHKDPNNRASVKELLRHKWILQHTTNFRTRMSPLALSDITAQELLSFNDSAILQLLKPTTDEAKHPMELSQEKRYEVLHSLRFKNGIMREVINELLHRRQMLGKLDEKQFTRLLDAVRLLEKNFVTSDEKLAHLVYGDKLAINQFFSGNKGVLLTRKGVEKKSRWHKRWILLKDNFLFLYESADPSSEPVDVVLLSQPLKIVPAAERDVGKKFCFQITTKTRSWFFAAATGKFMVKWLSDLSQIKNWYDDEVSTAPPLPQPLSPRRVVSLTQSKSEEKSFDADLDSPPLSPVSEGGAHTKIASGVSPQVSSAVLSSVASDGTIPVQRKLGSAGHTADLTQSLAGLAVKRSDASEPLVIDLAALRKQREKDEKKRQKELRRADGTQSARVKHTSAETSPRSKSSDHASNSLLKMATLSNSPSSESVGSLGSSDGELKAEKDRKWGREALKRALSMSEPNSRDNSPTKKKASIKKELSAKRLSSMIGFRARSRTSHPRLDMREAKSSPVPSPSSSPRSSEYNGEAPDDSAAAVEREEEEDHQQQQVRIAPNPATVFTPKSNRKGSLKKTVSGGVVTIAPASSESRAPVPALVAPNSGYSDSGNQQQSSEEEEELDWEEPELLNVLGQLMEQEERARAEAEVKSSPEESTAEQEGGGESCKGTPSGESFATDPSQEDGPKELQVQVEANELEEQEVEDEQGEEVAEAEVDVGAEAEAGAVAVAVAGAVADVAAEEVEVEEAEAGEEEEEEVAEAEEEEEEEEEEDTDDDFDSEDEEDDECDYDSFGEVGQEEEASKVAGRPEAQPPAGEESTSLTEPYGEQPVPTTV